MKTTLLLLLFICPLGAMFAQNELSGEIVKAAYVTTSNARYTSLDNYLPDDVLGSPYGEEIFQPGIIYENGEAAVQDYFLRYNAYENDIEVKKQMQAPDSDIFILTKASNIFAKIGSYIYVFNEVENAYYHVLFMGKNFKLYKQLNKRLYPAKMAKTSFEKDHLAEFKDRPEYFLISKEGAFHKVPSSKNKRIKFFGNKKSEIEKYVKKNNLDISEEDVLIKAVRYFNSFNDSRLK
jgi:hypothetical protein